MSFRETAIRLSVYGFYVFPLQPGGKLPAISDFPNRATRDPKQITQWWVDTVTGFEQPFNIGISTTQFGNGALLVVDVDTKKKGFETLNDYAPGAFPETATQRTASGGAHLFYTCPTPVPNGVDTLGPGLDVRSFHGYVVAPGSLINGQPYAWTADPDTRPLAPAPAWLVTKCGEGKRKREDAPAPGVKLNPEVVEARAIAYLQRAPLAREGEGGDQITFQVAAHLKDIGVEPARAVDLLLEYWNPRCSPPWDSDELERKAANAYTYGRNRLGAEAPENLFTELPVDETPAAPALPAPEPRPPSKIDDLNARFALVVQGGGTHVIWETKNYKGDPVVEHLGLSGFRDFLANETVDVGNGKRAAASDLWLCSTKRRTYHGIVFSPGRDVPKEFFNLWRGFAVQPLAPGEAPTPVMRQALERFLHHAETNVCRGNADEFEWLMSFFAHMVQKPWEKPHCAIVMRGRKGVGKNFIMDSVGRLLGQHYHVVADRRYLTGNFNSHLENLLFFVLDEAFWSGEKSTEGILKDLITNEVRTIERKGLEPYRVDSPLRVGILGNERWIVPASDDERRYSVFTVGDAYKQHPTYFQELREWLQAGGARYLLTYLLQRDISKFNHTQAIQTDSLLEQKEESLSPVYQWLQECLDSGEILGAAGFGSDWPVEVEKQTLRNSFNSYSESRHIRSWRPTERSFTREFLAAIPGAKNTRVRRGEVSPRVFTLPPLSECRREWERFIGHKVKWSTPDETEQLQDALS